MFVDGVGAGLTESLDIVRSLKDNKIVNIERVYNNLTLDDYLSERKGVSENEIFNIISGSILLHLDNGDVIAFDCEDIKDSVVVWFDKHQGQENENPYFYREWYSFMSYDDKKYGDKGCWRHIIGHSIKKITVLKIDKGEVAYFDDSQQRVIILETSDGDMVISFCALSLPGGSPFPLTRKSDIPQELFDKAEVIEL